LLHFTAELFQGHLKRAIRVHDNLCHGNYQRERPAEPTRWPPRGWG
jgi:hypothetical protein